MNRFNRVRHSVRLAVACLLSAALLLTGCSGSGLSGQANEEGSLNVTGSTEENSAASSQSSTAEGQVLSADTTVHFIDVGQGLSVLIQSDGHFMLYDGGDRNASSLVVSYLQEQGVKTLDYVIASHYDADHLNGVVGALNVYETEKVLAPDYETDTRVFQSFQSVIREKDIPLIHPKPGETYQLGNASFTVLAPQSRSYSSANDYSVAIRLTAGDVSFLITGDAESESEAEMIKTGLPLESTVYAAGHHGSASSGSWDFLQRAVPEYAVISCGAGNSYGHPHVETMEKFEAMGIEIFRTDKQGTITVSTDGSSLTWSVSPCSDYTPGDPDDKPARPAGGSSEDSSVSGFGPSAGSEPSGTVDGNGLHTYILNTSSKLIHMPDCRSVSDMSDKNKAEWSGESFDQCLKENPGYRGCKSCNPS